MASTRSSTPPPRDLAAGVRYPSCFPPHRTGSPNDNNIIIGSNHTVVPPSPGGPPPDSVAPTTSELTDHPSPIAQSKQWQSDRTGAGVKKPLLNKKAVGDFAKHLCVGYPKFRFLDLPGEIRNMIYHHTNHNPKQALLVHRPRLASLRSRTRYDRARPLASEVLGQEHDEKLSTVKRKHGRRNTAAKSKNGTWNRETNRPFFGFTQVCQQIREEYRSIYLTKQEIGMDFTDTVKYLHTFYHDVQERMAALGPAGSRSLDMPFTGNLTIAVGDKASAVERVKEGIDVFPLLDIWANSLKIEAGFGRYLKANYVPETDGEAKDLYRLFGRHVLRNRTCSPMNQLWRAILRNRSLFSVRVHREPAGRRFIPPNAIRIHPTLTQPTKPYLHIIFKTECAEPWMTKFESDIPKSPRDWLADHGFNGMEYFDVRVGVAASTATAV